MDTEEERADDRKPVPAPPDDHTMMEPPPEVRPDSRPNESATHRVPEPTNARSDQRTTTGGPDAWDTRTHVDRINPGSNPADIPGQGIVHTRDQYQPENVPEEPTMTANDVGSETDTPFNPALSEDREPHKED
jgi:hypothetical protein